MLNIVFVSSDYLPNIGGVATHVHELARACGAMGHGVSVVSMAPGKWNQVSTWRAHRRATDGISASYFSTAGLPGGHLTWWQLRRQAREYVRRLGGDRPAIFHVHDCGYGEYLAPHLVPGVKVFTNHTSGFLQDFDDDQGRDAWRQRILKYDHVIAPSTELATKTRETGYPSDQVTFIPNGVDPTKFRPDGRLRQQVRARLGISADEVVILAARRFVPKNGMIDLAHSLRFISPRARDHVTVVFAGNGHTQSDPLGYEKECLAAIRATPLGRRAVFAGAVDNAKMPELFAAADMSILPSLKEATSIAGLEAMSTAVTLIGTRVGGIPELIQNEVTGLLVEPGDPRELAEAITRLALDGDLRTRLGINARQRVLSEFTWSHVAARTVAVYESLLPRHNTHPAFENTLSHAH